MTTNPQTAHRAVLTVTVASRSDGGHYFDQADFTGHVREWVRAALKGKHAVDEVTVVDQAAELARAQAEARQYRTALQGVARRAAVSVSAAAPPTDRGALHARVAAAMREHYLCTNREEADADGNSPCRCGDWREPGAEVDDENDWDSHLADVALTAVLPPPADRAAVLREAAERLETRAAGLDQLSSSDYDEDAHAARILRAEADELRRQAEESAVTPPPALTEIGRLRAQVEVLQQDAERDRGLARVGARCMRDGHQGLIEHGRGVIEGWRFALSTALGLDAEAPWEAIHERVKELRRLAAEAPEPATQAEAPGGSPRPVIEHALTAYGYSPDTARTLIDRLTAEQGDQ